MRFTTAFRAAHPALKLQLYVADLGAARGADLMVDSLCVGSLPPQFAEEFTDGKLDFRAANTLLRSGRGAEAAAVYEPLFWQNPLRRSEERRVGKACVSPCRSRSSPDP